MHANDLASDDEAAHLEKPKSHKFKFDVGSCNLSRFKEEDVVNSKYQKVIFLWIFRMRLQSVYHESNVDEWQKLGNYFRGLLLS